MTQDTRPTPQHHRPASSPYLGPNREYWLHRILRYAAERSWCVNLGCTTCGASKFRDALRLEAFKSAGRVPGKAYDRLSALHLAMALASLNPDRDEAPAIEGAAIVAISELYSSPLAPDLIDGIFEGHWVAELHRTFRFGSGHL